MPGPDGIAAEFYKTYAKLLAPVFQEAWQELLTQRFSAAERFGERKWLTVPKVPGASTTAQLRDLELLNVFRKLKKSYFGS